MTAAHPGTPRDWVLVIVANAWHFEPAYWDNVQLSWAPQDPK